MRHCLKSAGNLAVLVAVGIATRGQEPPEPRPVFPAGTELVTVDAVVLNRQGVPVTGLRASDFRLSEDGAQQEIVSFEAVQRRAPTGPVGPREAALPPRVSSDRAAVAGSTRTFLAVFDDLHMGPTEAARARAAVASLLQSTTEGDRVTLVATNGAPWWHARMPDGREELLRILPRLRGRAGTLDDDDALRVTLEILVRALASLDGVRGRKSVLFLSGGFAYDSTFAGLFHEAVTEARRVNAVIYFVDARGLVALAPSGTRGGSQGVGSPLAGSAGSASLAWDTGGFAVEGRNDLADGVRSIARESSSYYLLGYVPPERGREGFRRIEVKVAREGVRVRARRGYYATASRDSEGSRERALRRALDSPFDLEGIPLCVAAHVFEGKTPGQARVLITTEVDLQVLHLREGGRAPVDALEYRLLVAPLETGSTLAGERHVPVRLRPEAREPGPRRWLPITSEATLAPGRHQARVVVAEANEGWVGSVSLVFDVPPLDGLRVSTPVLSDRLREPPGAGPELIARRTFAPSGVLHCLIEVYGAAKDPFSGRPAVSAALAVRRADGLLLASAEATRIEPGPGGVLARTLGVRLDGAPAGSYEMIVVVEDEVARRSAEARGPFVVDPAAGS